MARLESRFEEFSEIIDGKLKTLIVMGRDGGRLAVISERLNIATLQVSSIEEAVERFEILTKGTLFCSLPLVLVWICLKILKNVDSALSLLCASSLTGVARLADGRVARNGVNEVSLVLFTVLVLWVLESFWSSRLLYSREHFLRGTWFLLRRV